jgi:beta-galactosidase
VHVFSAANEAELFLNGRTQGRIKKEASNYRFRWYNVKYEAGELHVVTYKDGKAWANDTVHTTGPPARLRLRADRARIDADGYDLSFLTLEVVDEGGELVPDASNLVTFAVSSGEGEIVATDNGNPYDMAAFTSKQRKAFSGMALSIVRAKPGVKGAFTVTATAGQLLGANVTILTQ